jgi:NDP-sugar pyrophosphorylase family protein
MSEPASNKPAPVMAILAGGLATRLRPLTETIPKSMIEVAGEPFIAHQLRMLAIKGITDVVILCGVMGEQIVDFVQDGNAFGCSVRYCFDGEIRRGTGGAIRNALPMLGEKFMVVYGDSYCDTDYLRIFESFLASGKLGLMTVFQNENNWDKSNVIFRDNQIVRYDKEHQTAEMNYIDYGINVFSAKAFDAIPQEPAFDLATLQMELIRRNSLAGFQVFERFYEVGSHAGLAETDSFLLRQGNAGAANSGEI